MKRCRRCERELGLEHFHRYREGHQDWCKECKKEYSADYYQRNRERLSAAHTAYRHRAVAWFRELKTDSPCSDCGGIFHPAAMQWDHPPGVDKVAHVAKLYAGRRDRVLAEIAKCELVCANCHHVRTYERRRQASSAT